MEWELKLSFRYKKNSPLMPAGNAQATADAGPSLPGLNPADHPNIQNSYKHGDMYEDASKTTPSSTIVTTWADSVGTDDLQSLPNPPDYVTTGGFDTARFVQANSDYLGSSSNNLRFASNQAFSIQALLNHSETTGNHGVYGNFTLSPDDEGYTLQIESLKPSVTMRGTTFSQLVKKTGDNNLTAGAWHTLLMTYSGNGRASGINIYIDGVLQPATVNSDVQITSTWAHTSNFLIATLVVGINHLDADYLQIDTFGAAVNATDAADMDTYLRAFYGL